MEVYKLLLYIHIICGAISLLTGMVVMFNKKGDPIHKKIGSVFFYTLTISSLASIPITYSKSNYFLFLISIFTLFMLLTGKRYINKKSIKDVNLIDWLLTIMMSLGAVGFVIYAILLFISGKSFGIVLFVFGFIGILFAFQDFRNYKGLSKIKNWQVTTHIQRMVGGFIASSTAFLVVNNKWLPNEVGWLLPTVLMVPLIIKWSRSIGVKKL